MLEAKKGNLFSGTFPVLPSMEVPPPPPGGKDVLSFQLL